MPEHDTTTPGTGHPAPEVPEREQGRDRHMRDPWLMRWRAPLIASLAAVFVVFGILDLGSIFFHTGSQIRPIVIHAQIYEGPTSAPRSALVLQPQEVSLSCRASGQVILLNPSAHARQWTLVAPSSGIQFSPDSPRNGTLAAGARETLTVNALGQPGTYEIRVTDDQGAATTGKITVRCQ